MFSFLDIANPIYMLECSIDQDWTVLGNGRPNFSNNIQMHE